MQIADSRLKRPKRTQNKESRQSMRRAFGYLARYPKVTLGATFALLAATAAQLAVPQMIQNIIDTIVNSAGTGAIFSLPEEVQTLTSERLGLDLEEMQLDIGSAPRALILVFLCPGIPVSNLVSKYCL